MMRSLFAGVSGLRKRTKVPAIIEAQPEGRQSTDISGRFRRGDDPKRTAGDKT